MLLTLTKEVLVVLQLVVVQVVGLHFTLLIYKKDKIVTPLSKLILTF